MANFNVTLNVQIEASGEDEALVAADSMLELLIRKGLAEDGSCAGVENVEAHK